MLIQDHTVIRVTRVGKYFYEIFFDIYNVFSTKETQIEQVLRTFRIN